MAHIAINQVPLRPGSDAAAAQALQGYIAARRPLLGGDVLAMYAIRAGDSDTYALISVWSSREANARYEGDAAEQALRAVIGPLAAGPIVELEGKTLAELR